MSGVTIGQFSEWYWRYLLTNQFSHHTMCECLIVDLYRRDPLNFLTARLWEEIRVREGTTECRFYFRVSGGSWSGVDYSFLLQICPVVTEFRFRNPLTLVRPKAQANQHPLFGYLCQWDAQSQSWAGVWRRFFWCSWAVWGLASQHSLFSTS